MKKEENKVQLEERFDDCGFLKVKINKRLRITDHGLLLDKRCGNECRFTLFVFHKLLFIVALLLTIIYDITKSNDIRITF